MIATEDLFEGLTLILKPQSGVRRLAHLHHIGVKKGVKLILT